MRRVIAGMGSGGGQSRTFVDAAAVRAIANQFNASAELIDGAARTHLATLAFGGATAGRAHIAHGDALRAELVRLAAALSQWSRAAVEIAVTLRTTSDRYADAELRSAARLG